ECWEPAGALPERIGGYVVVGAIRGDPTERLLVAEDPGLARKVWIWLRPKSWPPLSAARRELARAGRLRWLGCGEELDTQWDAFLAPIGVPLAGVVGKEGKLSWLDVRVLLTELAEELTAAGEDGTLPLKLSIHQVWVQANDRVLLLDLPLRQVAFRAPKE